MSGTTAPPTPAQTREEWQQQQRTRRADEAVRALVEIQAAFGRKGIPYSLEGSFAVAARIYAALVIAEA